MIKDLRFLRAELALSKFRSHREFLSALATNGGVRISETRFSKILTGQYLPRPEEKEWISLTLQKPQSELFRSE